MAMTTMSFTLPRRLTKCTTKYLSYVHKLHQCGVQGKLLKWIEQFLTNREQFVTINGFHSMLALVLSDVPQGSVLGPIFFLEYINDLQFHLKGSTAGSFADDTRLSK